MSALLGSQFLSALLGPQFLSAWLRPEMERQLHTVGGLRRTKPEGAIRDHPRGGFLDEPYGALDARQRLDDRNQSQFCRRLFRRWHEAFLPKVIAERHITRQLQM